MTSPTSSPASAAYANPTVPLSYATATTNPFDAPAYQAPRPSAGSSPALGLDLLVTPAQRERAEGFLQEAYADGRLTHSEFEVRLDQVLGASTRRELNQAFYGLVSVPSAAHALGLHPAYRPSLVNQGAGGRTGKAMAALSHFSVFFFWLFGPLVMYMLGSKGSYAKRQAAQSFNFQVYTLIGGVLGAFASELTGNGVIMLIGMVGWFVLTLVGGVKASQGEEWTNPVNRVIPWKPLDEKR